MTDPCLRTDRTNHADRSFPQRTIRGCICRGNTVRHSPTSRPHFALDDSCSPKTVASCPRLRLFPLDESGRLTAESALGGNVSPMSSSTFNFYVRADCRSALRRPRCVEGALKDQAGWPYAACLGTSRMRRSRPMGRTKHFRSPTFSSLVCSDRARRGLQHSTRSCAGA